MQIIVNMGKIFIFGLLLLVISPNLVKAQKGQANTGNSSEARNNKDGVAMEAVIKTLRESIQESEENKVEGFPDLKEATVELNTLVTRGGGGKITFLVFSIGSDRKYEDSSKLTVKLIPPKPNKRIMGLNESLKETLAQAINLAKQATINANSQAGELPKLNTQTVTIELKFTVQRSVEGGVTIADILPIGIEAKGKVEKTRIHTLTLVFGDKKDDEKE